MSEWVNKTCPRANVEAPRFEAGLRFPLRRLTGTLPIQTAMNPLPRFLGMALFVVLAILAALLALSTQAPVPLPPKAGTAAVATVPTTPPASAAVSSGRPAVMVQRVALAVAIVGLLVAGALVFTLALRPAATSDAPSLAGSRHEMGALTRLAQSSVAQEAELSRERDVRRRAEEDAELKQQLLAQSVDEKIRLGRDLHDGIIQSLYAVGLTLETMRPLLKTSPAEAEKRLDEVRTSLNAAIRDVRGYITGLAPENLRRASFSRSVAALFEQLRAGRDAQFEIKVDDDAAALLSLDQNIEALQIAREAISNALRHGNARHITLRMHQGDAEVCLAIEDDGTGFAAAAPGSGNGHGLANMRARAERVGASLRITSSPGQGARIIVTFSTHTAPLV